MGRSHTRKANSEGSESVQEEGGDIYEPGRDNPSLFCADNGIMGFVGRGLLVHMLIVEHGGIISLAPREK